METLYLLVAIDVLPRRPGYFEHLGLCHGCAAGTSQGEPGSTSCDICSPGFVATGTTSVLVVSLKCTACSAGKYEANDAHVECLPCDPGTIAEKGQTMCNLCPSGSFERGDRIECAPCGEGTYTAVAGSTECGRCDSYLAASAKVAGRNAAGTRAANLTPPPQRPPLISTDAKLVPKRVHAL